MYRRIVKVFLLSIICGIFLASSNTFADGEGMSWGSGNSSGGGGGYGWSLGTASEALSHVTEGTPSSLYSNLEGVDGSTLTFYYTDANGNLANPNDALSQTGKDADGKNFDRATQVLENGMTLDEAIQTIVDATDLTQEDIANITADQIQDILNKIEQQKQQQQQQQCSCPDGLDTATEQNSAYGTTYILPPCSSGICETPDDTIADFLHVFTFVPGCHEGACAMGSVKPPIVHHAVPVRLGESVGDCGQGEYEPTANFAQVVHYSPIPNCQIEYHTCNCRSCGEDGEDTCCDTCPVLVCDCIKYGYTCGESGREPWFWAGNSGNEVVETCGEVRNPYNYKNTATADPPITDQVYTGEKTEIGGKVKNETAVGSGGKNTHTFSNKTTTIQLIEFTVAPEKSPDTGGSEASSSAPCEYYQGKMGDSVIWECNHVIDEQKLLAPEDNPSLGWSNSVKYSNITRNIPDNKPIGTKYCWAIGAYTSDSGGSGMGNPPTGTWVISGASCTTISKKPNFQVWNSGLYTGGSVSATLSPKIIPNITPNTPTNSFEKYNGNGSYGTENLVTRTFGSWEEQLAIVGRNVQGFASGSAIAYGDYRFALTGGKAGSASTGQISPLTISNSNSSAIGYSGVNAEAAAYTLINRLQARYPASEEVSNISTTVLHERDVKVYHSSGDININGDICYGSCSAHTSPQQTTTLKQQDFDTNAISDLPQAIIIADGNINISGNVERIDAWLIAKDGIVNTCSTFNLASTESGYNNGFGGGRDTKGCNRQLIVNGPVIARNLALNRTAGAYSTYDKDNIAAAYGGYDNYEGGDVRNQNLANDGSITPAEIFNLRPDTYLWAYSQAQEFTEAVVTYSRELAPRL